MKKEVLKSKIYKEINKIEGKYIYHIINKDFEGYPLLQTYIAHLINIIRFCSMDDKNLGFIEQLEEGGVEEQKKVMFEEELKRAPQKLQTLVCDLSDLIMMCMEFLGIKNNPVKEGEMEIFHVRDVCKWREEGLSI